MNNKKIRVAITHGDTNGIGYELILKTFAQPEMLELCTPIIYGSPKIATYHKKALGLNTNFTVIDKAEDATDGKVNLLNAFDDEVKIDMGESTPEAGESALKSLDRAMTDFRSSLFDVLVTAPLNPHNIPTDLLHFTGHTAYIENCVGEGVKALLVYIHDDLRVASVVTGMPFKQVCAAVTKEAIINRATVFHNSLRRDFSIQIPRIAILSLNPHAGSVDTYGTEEKDIIMPAINTLEEQGIQAFGPYAADDFFGKGYFCQFDGILAMYEDQALGAFKLLASDDAIQYTAGLPIIRTSTSLTPSYDHAGKGDTDEQTFREAIYAAIDIFRNRIVYDEPTGNPLPKLYREHRDDSEKVRFAVPRPQRDGRREGFTPRYNDNKTSNKFQTTAPKEISTSTKEATATPNETSATPNETSAIPKGAPITPKEAPIAAKEATTDAE